MSEVPQGQEPIKIIEIFHAALNDNTIILVDENKPRLKS